MPSLNEIRATYLNFFAADGHEKVHSAPLVPHRAVCCSASSEKEGTSTTTCTDPSGVP